MNTRLLAFLGATTLFVPGSTVLASSATASTSVQSGKSRFAGASQVEMSDLRRDFGRAIDNVRFNLERRLLALDLSDPSKVTEFEDAQRVLAAWDDMATYLPQMSDEQLKVATAPLEELDHLVRFQQRLAAAPASSSRGVARTCTNSGVTRSEYPGGDQSPVLLPQTLIDLITNLGQPTGRLWSAMELAFVQSVGAFPPGVLNSFAYAPGLEGEKQMNDFKALFEYYSGHFPQISLMETAPGIPGRLITISHPFKVIFDNEGRKNSMVLANAQFMNDDFGECQLANVAEMVSNLATVMDVGEVNTKLDSVITKVDSRASATDLASFRTDLTARVDSRASALDLATFRTDTGTGIGNVRSDIATVRAGAAFAFQGLSTKVDTRASFIEAALAARANELQLKLNTAEGMLLLILDEVD